MEIIEKHKPRLVKRFKQELNVNYFDTYSPLSRITSIPILIAIITINKLENTSNKSKKKKTFLNGDLDEEVYIERPEWFVIKRRKRKRMLAKSLYGLKQAPNNGMKSLIKLCCQINLKLMRLIFF